jgi:hypothetical protein
MIQRPVLFTEMSASLCASQIKDKDLFRGLSIPFILEIMNYSLETISLMVFRQTLGRTANSQWPTSVFR